LKKRSIANKMPVPETKRRKKKHNEKLDDDVPWVERTREQINKSKIREKKSVEHCFFVYRGPIVSKS
jgi:hypothetical protein